MKERLPFRPTTPLTPPGHGKEAVVGRKGRLGRKVLHLLITPSKGKELKHGTSPTMLPPNGRETCFLKNIHSQRIFPDKNDTRI